MEPMERMYTVGGFARLLAFWVGLVLSSGLATPVLGVTAETGGGKDDAEGQGESVLSSYTRAEKQDLAQAVASSTGEIADVIRHLERAARRRPKSWVFRYALCDQYMSVGRLAKAVRVGEDAYNLRPKDVRSPYALATAYRALTHAAYIGNPRIGEARALGMDPEGSQKALAELGITIEDAVRKAIELFRIAKQLTTNGDARAQIEDNLESMRVEFPEVK